MTRRHRSNLVVLIEDNTFRGVVFTSIIIMYIIMKRIKITDCSVATIAIAEPLGFKTLSSFEKFVNQCKPNARLYSNGMSVSIADVLRKIAREKTYH